jgi:hypothetical protein
MMDSPNDCGATLETIYWESDNDSHLQFCVAIFNETMTAVIENAKKHPAPLPASKMRYVLFFPRNSTYWSHSSNDHQ